MANPFFSFMCELEDLPEPLNKDAVKSLLIEHFDGRRVFFNYNEQRHARKALAHRLIRRGFSKDAAVQVLIDTFRVSKTWSYSLIEQAINEKMARQLEADRKALQEYKKRGL